MLCLFRMILSLTEGSIPLRMKNGVPAPSEKMAISMTDSAAVVPAMSVKAVPNITNAHGAASRVNRRPMTKLVTYGFSILSIALLAAVLILSNNVK